MYEQGIGVGKDEKEAFVWYNKSAMQGNSAAQFNLAVMHENGRGTKVALQTQMRGTARRRSKGTRWRSAIRHAVPAGDGVQQNKVAGVALLLLSASRDPSPQNHAKQNLAGARGLTAETAAAAQTLFNELNSTQNCCCRSIGIWTRTDGVARFAASALMRSGSQSAALVGRLPASCPNTMIHIRMSASPVKPSLEFYRAGVCSVVDKPPERGVMAD